jgi:hypothetical protein
VHLIDHSFFDCDPLGVIPINDATPPLICLIFGNDAEAATGVVHDMLLIVLSDPAHNTSGNSCDHQWTNGPMVRRPGV